MAHSRPEEYSFRIQRLSGKCKALGYPARIEILNKLIRKGHFVNELTKVMPITQGAVSGHLEILKRQGFVEVEEKGLYNLYSYDIDKLVWLHEELGKLIKYQKRLAREAREMEGKGGWIKKRGDP